jgi:hypothetical protein
VFYLLPLPVEGKPKNEPGIQAEEKESEYFHVMPPCEFLRFGLQ